MPKVTNVEDIVWEIALAILSQSSQPATDLVSWLSVNRTGYELGHPYHALWEAAFSAQFAHLTVSLSGCPSWRELTLEGVRSLQHPVEQLRAYLMDNYTPHRGMGCAYTRLFDGRVFF